ncbi:14442_t:CDS:2, partial [Entrophospora sp. SA101]
MVIDLESLFSSKPHMEKNMEYYSHRIMLDTEEETDFNPSDFDSSNSGKEYVRLYAFPIPANNLKFNSSVNYPREQTRRRLADVSYRRVSKKINEIEYPLFEG